MVLSAQLIAISNLVQAVELFCVRKNLDFVWGKTGNTYFKKVRLGGITVLSVLRILLSIATIAAPSGGVLLALLFIYFLSLLYFSGPFNGGSDALSTVALICMTIAFLSDGKVALAALWYLSLQVSLSYLKAGFHKVCDKEWRSGDALLSHLTNPLYTPTLVHRIFARLPKAVFLLSWIVILFELTFPLIFLGGNFLVTYLACGLLFHFFISYLMGLNRFLLTWPATYPVLIYCAQSLH